MKALAWLVFVLLAIFWFSAHFGTFNYTNPSIEAIKSTREKEQVLIDSAIRSNQ